MMNVIYRFKCLNGLSVPKTIQQYKSEHVKCQIGLNGLSFPKPLQHAQQDMEWRKEGLNGLSFPKPLQSRIPDILCNQHV